MAFVQLVVPLLKKVHWPKEGNPNVDTGCIKIGVFFFLTKGMRLRLEFIGGIKNTIFGGEGLFFFFFYWGGGGGGQI